MKLDIDKPINYITSSYRHFSAGERHISRVARYSVLLLVYDGILRFGEEGEQIEVKSGEYYIQRAGLRQDGLVPSDSPRYYYVHFDGDFSEEEAFELFDEQIRSGVPEKPDLIVLETFMDADMLRVAAEAAAKHDLPIFATMTFTEVGKTIMGHSVERFVETMEGLPIAAVGLNCSLGPEKAVDVIASFRQYTDLPLIFKPNAGKPIVVDGQERVEYDVDTFVADSLPALRYGVRYLGACCGSSPSYIRALSKAIYGK